MKNCIYLLLFLLPSHFLSAQTNIDSLERVLNTQELTSEEKIQFYWDLMNAYRTNDLDKAILFAKKGVDLSEKEHNDLKIAQFNRVLGFTYISKNEYDSSLFHLNNAIAIAIKINNKLEENIATVYMGSLHLQQAKYEQALYYFMSALPTFKDLDKNDQYATTLLNVAITYRSLRNNEKALDYCGQALEIADKYNIPYPQMVSFEMKGDIYYAQQQYDSAAVYLSEAYKIGHQLNDRLRLVTSTQILTKVFCCLEEFDKAEKYANECLEIANELGGNHTLFMAWSTMTYLRFEQKRYEESAKYAYKMWKTDSTNLFWARNTAQYLCDINMFLNNPEEATYFFDKYITIRDQIGDQELYDSLAEMEVKYETEKKEIRIAALEEERKLHLGLGIAILAALLSAIGLLFYRHRLTAQKKKLAEQQIKQFEQEKELIAARSALEVEKKEREIIARDLHDGVGTMLTVVKNNMNVMKPYSIIENTDVEHFNNALDMLDKSITELRRVAHHILPDDLIKNGLAIALDNFCRSSPNTEFHSTSSNRRFDQEKELMLYRCAYELVNNAMRHAKASQIDVHLNMDEKTIYLSIVDNGCGFDPQTSVMGMGLNNMRTRLAVFGGTIDIYSEQDKGTEVNIELNL